MPKKLSKAQAVKRMLEANDKLDKARNSNMALTKNEKTKIINFQFYLDDLVKKYK